MSSKLWLGVPLIAIGVGAWYLIPRPSAGQAKADKEKAAARPVPVTTAVARTGDLRVYLTGLGNVAAFNTVTVRSRVDGEIVNVAFTEGQLVQAGDLLVEIDPRPFQVQLSQAQGQLERDMADLKNAKLNLERLKTARDAFSDQQIDTQQAAVNQIEGVVKVDQAAIDQANLLLTFSHIRAPISGRIGLRLTDKGNYVRANNAADAGLAVITQVQPIAVFFAIPQTEIARIVKQPKGGAGLPVEVYDRDLKTRLATGKLVTHDNQIDPNTGTLRFKAVVANEDGTLFPNQFVNVRLLVDTKKDATMVPPAAIQRSPRSTFVYVVKTEGAESSVELRDVTVGVIEGDTASIDSGLASGEVVVTEGVDKLQPGSKVTMPDAKAEKTDRIEKGEKKREKKSR